MHPMGQVLTFPTKQAKQEVSHERRAAFITGICAMTYLLGFFIIGPSLAIFAFGFATTTHIASCAMCLAGLAITWALTRAAYKHL